MAALLALLCYLIAAVLAFLDALTVTHVNVFWVLGFIAAGLVFDHLGAVTSYRERP